MKYECGRVALCKRSAYCRQFQIHAVTIKEMVIYWHALTTMDTEYILADPHDTSSGLLDGYTYIVCVFLGDDLLFCNRPGLYRLCCQYPTLQLVDLSQFGRVSSEGSLTLPVLSRDVI